MPIRAENKSLISGKPPSNRDRLIRVIQTTYDGILFRSRTEARWAVFFKTCGIRFEYEKEGFILGGEPYLPDFYLPVLDCWLEVKGVEPTPDEVEKCRLLARMSDKLVLLAIGTPQEGHEQIVPFNGGGVEQNARDGDDNRLTQEWPCRYQRFYFVEDRKIEGTFWLLSDDAGGIALNEPSSDRYPGYPGDQTSIGYASARSARFTTA